MPSLLQCNFRLKTLSYDNSNSPGIAENYRVVGIEPTTPSAPSFLRYGTYYRTYVTYVDTNPSIAAIGSPYVTSTYVIAIVEIFVPKNTREYLSPYERFVRTPSKSFFKELFLGNTQLGLTLKKMSERNGVLKGLKDQECEKGNRSK